MTFLLAFKNDKQFLSWIRFRTFCKTNCLPSISPSLFLSKQILIPLQFILTLENTQHVRERVLYKSQKEKSHSPLLGRLSCPRTTWSHRRIRNVLVLIATLSHTLGSYLKPKGLQLGQRDGLSSVILKSRSVALCRFCHERIRMQPPPHPSDTHFGGFFFFYPLAQLRNLQASFSASLFSVSFSKL